MLLQLIKSKIKGFPLRIKGVYPYFEYCYKDKTKYCINLWKNIDWSTGCTVPMFKKDNIIVYYKITSCYYKMGNSMSDWAWGDDGKYRDMQFHHTEKEENK